MRRIFCLLGVLFAVLFQFTAMAFAANQKKDLSKSVCYQSAHSTVTFKVQQSVIPRLDLHWQVIRSMLARSKNAHTTAQNSTMDHRKRRWDFKLKACYNVPMVIPLLSINRYLFARRPIYRT